MEPEPTPADINGPDLDLVAALAISRWGDFVARFFNRIDRVARRQSIWGGLGNYLQRFPKELRSRAALARS